MRNLSGRWCFCSRCGNKLFEDQVSILETKLQGNAFTKFGYSKKDVIAHFLKRGNVNVQSERN